MIAHAVALFRLNKKRKDGTTERDHLMAHARITGKIPQELRVPSVPAGTESLWKSFEELSCARSSSGTGLGSIGLCDIQAWQHLFEIRLNSWEIETILEIDRAVLSVINE